MTPTAGFRSRSFARSSRARRIRSASSWPGCSKASARFSRRCSPGRARFLSRSRASTRRAEQGWLAYTLAMLLFNAVGFVLLYALLRLQAVLPLNPQASAGRAGPRLQHRGQLRHQHQLAVLWRRDAPWAISCQMAGLTVQNFLSAATGMALAIALVRGFRARPAQHRRQFLGRYDPLDALCPAADLDPAGARSSSCPACRRTLAASVDATTLEGAKQTIALRARSPRRMPSSSSAPTAAASSTPTPRIRSRTRTPSATSSRSGRCW